jgi:hypothetical protein
MTGGTCECGSNTFEGKVWSGGQVPASPALHAAVDAALGLRETPPIRLPVEVYERLEREAAAQDLIMQAYIRQLLEGGIS